MILESVKRYLTSKEAPWMEGEGILKLDVEGDLGGWKVFLRAVDEENLLVIYTMFNYKVPPEKCDQMALLLTDINYGLKIGNFELNTEQGELHFKTYIDALMGPELTDEQIERAIHINIMSIEHYAPQLTKLVLE